MKTKQNQSVSRNDLQNTEVYVEPSRRGLESWDAVIRRTRKEERRSSNAYRQGRSAGENISLDGQLSTSATKNLSK